MTITPIFRPIVELDPLTGIPISPCSFTDSKEENLLKMGILNPEEFYYTDRKTADLTLRLFELFKSHSLHLIYETEKKEIIAYDSTFLDMDMIHKDIFRKYNLSPFRRNFPEFHMRNQTFCAQIEALDILLKLKTPDLRSWASLLNKSPKTISESDLIVQLPSRKLISQESFVENPIFKYTLEKYNVFRFISFFIKKNDFSIQYQNFLENIKKENWTSYYIENPRSLAYLSLVAFLDDQIKSEDLFVIHMVASAIHESSVDEQAEFTILQKDNVETYLTDAAYPLFSPVFCATKSENELEEAKRTFISNLKDKSPIQRTAIAYAIFSVFDDETEEDTSIEQELFYTMKTNIGHKKTSYAQSFRDIAILLPPLLCLELFEAASSLKEPPPKEHTWMFGYSNGKKSLEALKIGRPVSLASPLFRIPYVHDFKVGKQLGITIHDLLFHIALDWQNPHTRLFIHLGQTILDVSGQNREVKKFGIDFLDRATIGYSTIPTQDDKAVRMFWLSISNGTIPKGFEDTFIFILKNSLPSEILDLEIITALNEEYKNETEEFTSNIKLLTNLIEKLTSSKELD